ASSNPGARGSAGFGTTAGSITFGATSSSCFGSATGSASGSGVALACSYFSRQQNIVDDAGGRYARITPAKLTGQGPSVPQQPASSPWSQSLDELTGREPPIDIDIEFVGALGGESPAPVVVVTVETANATDDGGALPPKGRGSPLPVSARSFR